MARLTSPYLFDYSRNPVDSLLAQTTDDPRWFVANAWTSMKGLVRGLEAHPDVERCELETLEHTTHDELGAYATFHYKLHLTFRGTEPFTSTGSGHSRDRELARVIALAELFERLSISMHVFGFATRTRIGAATQPIVVDWSSNGASFHSSAVAALKGALCELLERDAFLTHWYAGRPLPCRDPDNALAARFARAGWKLREHSFRHDKVEAACVYLSVIREQPIADGWNFFLGCGAAPTYREATTKATNELLRMFRTWQAAYDVLDQSAQVSAEILANVLSRLVVYQRPEYIREFERMTSARSRAPQPIKSRTDREFVVDCMRALGDVRVVPLPVPQNLHAHVYSVKAGSAQLQNVDWSTPPQYNVARIRERYGTRKLNAFPHPIA
jgi:ribosomal protein S12 methylthiotransferase accessory factor YcaO